MKNLVSAAVRAGLLAASSNIRPGPASSAFPQQRKLSAKESQAAAIAARQAETAKRKG